VKFNRHSLVLLLLLAFVIGYAQRSKMDSLWSVYKNKSRPDTVRLKALSSISWTILSSKPDTVLILAKQQLDIVESMPIAKRGFWWGDAYNLTGVCYVNKGNYPKALNAYLKALDLFLAGGYKKGIADTYGNIGNIYYYQHDYKQTLEYYFKQLKVDEEINNRKGQATCMNNIGLAFKEEQNFTQALEYNFKALDIFEEIHNKHGIGSTYGYIGNAYLDQGKLDKSMEYYSKGLALQKEIQDEQGMGISYINLGELSFQMNNYKLAIAYADSSVKISKKIGYTDLERAGYKNLADAYSKTGKYKEAYESHVVFKNLTDSIYNAENSKQLGDIKTQLEVSKKEAELKLKSAVERETLKATATEAEKRQRVIIYAVLVALLIVILFSLFLISRFRIIQKQKRVIEEQKKVVDSKNTSITDSINYAKRIQQAKLPHRDEISASLPGSFVLFKPKDIVSGDFYFFHKIPAQKDGSGDERIFLAVADCTGHGVPGAFMSMIGTEKLEDAVAQSKDTAEILTLLDKGIRASLRQSDSIESTRDGMDIAICCISKKEKTLTYSGAHIPLWIVRNQQSVVEKVKATKKAIGGLRDDSHLFDRHELRWQEGDTFYLTTDGYADQFGGKKGKKLMTKRFKSLLLEIQHKSMNDQEKHLDDFAEKWKSNMEQVDDILVIGVRL
jgi:serine phosphatase RsbU (regulator of sigma subunit)/tetratricopeptide (TPR) repeat protein